MFFWWNIRWLAHVLFGTTLCHYVWGLGCFELETDTLILIGQRNFRVWLSRQSDHFAECKADLDIGSVRYKICCCTLPWTNCWAMPVCISASRSVMFLQLWHVVTLLTSLDKTTNIIRWVVYSQYIRIARINTSISPSDSLNHKLD